MIELHLVDCVGGLETAPVTLKHIESDQMMQEELARYFEKIRSSGYI